MKIVKVTWLDAAFGFDELVLPIQVCTYGLLVDAGEGVVAVAGEQLASGDYRGVTAIPSMNVIEVVELRAHTAPVSGYQIDTTDETTG